MTIVFHISRGMETMDVEDVRAFFDAKRAHRFVAKLVHQLDPEAPPPEGNAIWRSKGGWDLVAVVNAVIDTKEE